MWILLGLVADTRLVSLAARPFPTPLSGVFRRLCSADSSPMEPALSSAPIGAPETHDVLRDGTLVAVLRMLASEGAFTVVAELNEAQPGDNAVRLRQYTFARLDEASAFLAEVASSFAFLGCEIRRA
jgi:hypothetical protein